MRTRVPGWLAVPPRRWPFSLTLLTWAFASPVGSSPDDDSHPAEHLLLHDSSTPVAVLDVELGPRRTGPRSRRPEMGTRLGQAQTRLLGPVAVPTGTQTPLLRPERRHLVPLDRSVPATCLK